MYNLKVICRVFFVLYTDGMCVWWERNSDKEKSIDPEWASVQHQLYCSLSPFTTGQAQIAAELANTSCILASSLDVSQLPLFARKGFEFRKSRGIYRFFDLL